MSRDSKSILVGLKTYEALQKYAKGEAETVRWAADHLVPYALNRKKALATHAQKKKLKPKKQPMPAKPAPMADAPPA